MTGFTEAKAGLVNYLTYVCQVKDFNPSPVEVEVLHVVVDELEENEKRYQGLALELFREIFADHDSLFSGEPNFQRRSRERNQAISEITTDLRSRENRQLSQQFAEHELPFQETSLLGSVRKFLHVESPEEENPLEVVIVKGEGILFKDKAGIPVAEAIAVTQNGKNTLFILQETYEKAMQGDPQALGTIEHEYTHIQRPWLWGGGVLGQFFDERAAIVSQSSGNISHFQIRNTAILLNLLTSGGDPSQYFANIFNNALQNNTPELVVRTLREQFGSEFVMRLLLQRVDDEYADNTLSKLKVLGEDESARRWNMQTSLIKGALVHNPLFITSLIERYTYASKSDSATFDRLSLFASVLINNSSAYKVPGLNVLLRAMSEKQLILPEFAETVTDILRIWDGRPEQMDTILQ